MEICHNINVTFCICEPRIIKESIFNHWRKKNDNRENGKQDGRV